MYEGGAPLLRDALALDLANTHYAVRGKAAEGLRSAADLDAWLHALMPELAAGGGVGDPGQRDLERFLALRSAVRGVSATLVSGEPVSPGDAAAVNAAAQAAPSCPQLELGPDGTLAAGELTAAPVLDVALAALAADAVGLFTGERAARLRACQAPGCPLFFLKDHPRREWCSPACGARVRSSRAYRKRTAASA
ncbi:CGNR zinc finger domain-containing protein [Paeniglutamicibacter sp. MACA_103]|uniref:CGNR zinc finger domain-containing protein n=1 Tax=Paeniglutamicibacter sp. MACA_103 TaxID=3377337 RepID=UPI003894DECD